MRGKFPSVVIDVTSAQEERSVLEGVLLPSVVEESIRDTYRTIVVLPMLRIHRQDYTADHLSGKKSTKIGMQALRGVCLQIVWGNVNNKVEKYPDSRLLSDSYLVEDGGWKNV